MKQVKKKIKKKGPPLRRTKTRAVKKTDDFIKVATVKKYIKEQENFKSAGGAIETFIERFTQWMKEVLGLAKIVAEKEKRKTILQRDIEPAMDRKLEELKLSWNDLFDQLLKQNPTELGRIAQKIDIYLRKQK